MPASGTVLYNMTNMLAAGGCGKNNTHTKVLDVGQFPTWEACQTACNSSPTLCVTWTWHNIEEAGCYKGQCFLRGTDVWAPHPNSNHAVCGVKSDDDTVDDELAPVQANNTE